ncbi:MAG: hypothetical protein WCK65_03625 [Rhodospirillaceae bacterium]
MSRIKKDPLTFATSLDATLADAAKITGTLELTIRDGNQFWFVIPDGILPNNPNADVTVPYLRFTVEGRRATMLTRMVFTREGGVIADAATGKKFLLEFRPCVMLTRTKDGGTIVNTVEESDGVPVFERSQDKTAPPAPEPKSTEPQGTQIPDIGELLEGLRQTRMSLDTIDNLLTAPDNLLAEDEGKRRELQGTIAATKDKALIGLGQLGDVLARGTEQSLDEWREGVSNALNATIEAMVSFDDLAEHVRDGKRREMEALRQSIESFFATIDPKADADACRKFSTGVNQIILTERKDTLKVKAVKLEKNVERSYDHIIASLQQVLGKGSSVPLIPHPFAEPAPGYETKFVLNMIHIVMAVRFGGFSIRLDCELHPRLQNELRGWNVANLPRIHFTDRKNFAALHSSGGKRKLAIFE